MDANDAFIKATRTPLPELLDKPLFQVFPDLETDNKKSAIKSIRTALEKVRTTKGAYDLGPIRYDLPTGNGASSQINYWETHTSAVVDTKGELAYIIHTILDITSRVLNREEATRGLGEDDTASAPENKTRVEIELERNLRTIFNNSIEGFVLTDPDLKIKAFNNRAHDYILLKDSPLKFEEGKSLLDYIEDPWKEYFKKQVIRVLKDNVVQYQRPLFVEGEGFYCFSFSIYPIKEEGVITGVCISGRDITQQKMAEDRLEKSEKKFRGLIENSSDGIMLLGEDNIVKYVSPQVERITGLSWEVLLDSVFVSHFDSKNASYLNQLLERLKQKPGSQLKNVLISLAEDNGQSKWMEFTFSNMLKNEALGGIVVNFRDVTVRKQSEFELFKLNSRLISAQKIARLGYWEFDVSKDQLFWSDEHYDIWGWPKATSVSFDHFLGSVYVEDRDRLLEYHKETIAGKHNTDIVYRIKRADGVLRYVHALANSNCNEAGEVISMEGTVQDITDRILADLTIAESEEKYRKIFQNSPLPNWIYELETLKIVEVNEAAIRSYGYSREEFLSMSILDFRPIEDVLSVTKLVKEASRKRSSSLGAWRHRKKNGELILVEISSHAIQINQRECRLVIANDITTRAEAEKRLIESNERFILATRATSDAIWDFDLLNDRVFLGEGFSTLFGYQEAGTEVSSAWITALVHPDDFEEVWAGIGRTLADSITQYWHDEYLFQKAGGEYAIIVNHAVIVRDPGGKPVRMIGAMKDVTALKMEEHRLRLFESVITNTTDAVLITSPEVVVDGEVSIIYANPSFYRMTGFMEEEILGKRTSILTGPETDPDELQKLGNAIAEGKSCSIETVFYKKNGECYWGSLGIAPVRDETGLIKNYIAICRDITSSVNYVKEIEAQNKKLMDIAWVQSHIVRAPLSRILGLVNLMTMDPQQETLNELMPLLYQSAVDLDDVIKEIIRKTHNLA